MLSLAKKGIVYAMMRTLRNDADACSMYTCLRMDRQGKHAVVHLEITHPFFMEKRRLCISQSTRHIGNYKFRYGGFVGPMPEYDKLDYIHGHREAHNAFRLFLRDCLSLPEDPLDDDQEDDDEDDDIDIENDKGLQQAFADLNEINARLGEPPLMHVGIDISREKHTPPPEVVQFLSDMQKLEQTIEEPVEHRTVRLDDSVAAEEQLKMRKTHLEQAVPDSAFVVAVTEEIDENKSST